MWHPSCKLSNTSRALSSSDCIVLLPNSMAGEKRRGKAAKVQHSTAQCSAIPPNIDPSPSSSDIGARPNLYTHARCEASGRARLVTLPVEFDRNGQVVREGLALCVDEAVVDAPLSGDEGERGRAPIKHAVDAPRIGTVHGRTDFLETGRALEAGQHVTRATNVGIARQEDCAPGRSLLDGLHQLVDLRFAGSSICFTRTCVEVHIIDVDLRAISEALARRDEALRGQTIEVAVDHTVARAPAFTLHGSERLRGKHAQPIAEMESPFTHEGG